LLLFLVLNYLPLTHNLNRLFRKLAKLVPLTVNGTELSYLIVRLKAPPIGSVANMALF
jgi:hypothetical protein